MRRFLALAVLAATSGCFSRVAVAYSSSERPPPRPRGCDVPLFRTKPPERPYVEVATLHFSAVHDSTPQKVDAKVRAKACAIGADAVVITRDRALVGGAPRTTYDPGAEERGSTMDGIAIRWRDRGAEEAADAALAGPGGGGAADTPTSKPPGAT